MSDFWPHGAVASSYGVFNTEFGRSERATFIIDRAGVIRWCRIYETGVLPDDSETLEQLRTIGK